MLSATTSDGSRSLLLLFAAAMALCYSTTAQNETNIGSLIPEDVVVVPGANPRVAVIYWKPIADNRVSIYTVYYISNTTATNTEQRMEVISLANSAMIDSLEIGHHYSFTVSVGYIVNGVITMGPRSANANITTGLTTLNPPDDTTDDNAGSSVGAVIFYGCLLVISMVINLALLVMSYVLLRQLRLKYTGNGTASPCIDLQTRHDVDIHDDIPRKPAREHIPPKEIMIELQNGRCTTPAKQADVEAL